MKKYIVAIAFALFGAVAVMAEDVYTFKATINYPGMKVTKKLAYRDYSKTTLTGTLTVDVENTNQVAKLVATLKGTKETFTFDLGGDELAIVLGKKTTVVGNLISLKGASDSGSELELICAGKGTLKTTTVKSGCGPCGDSTTVTCSKVKDVTGNCVGIYKCPCDNPQFYVFDGTCEGITESTDNVAPIWGSWSVKLKK